MKLSVIVPAWNSRETITACLEAVKKSTYEKFELIVVNDGSTDGTAELARAHADRLVVHPQNLGRSAARNAGLKTMRGEIAVMIDSDVVVRPDSLALIADYFERHPEISALTGLLAKEHPNREFFSQYKNLYMHYMFRKLPERVTFLYGSIHALRANVSAEYGKDVNIADDTALGQELTKQGLAIGFVRDLQVVHLKKYDFAAFVKNDFVIPRDWARLFLRYRGWRQVSRKTGYAHSSCRQITGVILAPFILVALIALLVLGLLEYLDLLLCPAIAWYLLNRSFIRYLSREKGVCFGLKAMAVTFLDNIVMAGGIFSGFVTYAFFDNETGPERCHEA